MPNTNAPRNIATESGNISLETEIIDSQRRQRQVPIVDVNALNQILDEWENAMQSGEEIDLSSGSIEFICQYVLSRRNEPRNTRRVGGKRPSYADRKAKMYNRTHLT